MYATEQLAETAAINKSEDMHRQGITIDFDGMNCEDAGGMCDGWDGRSRRCECGNRRVGWSFTEFNDKTWGFYAEAY